MAVKFFSFDNPALRGINGPLLITGAVVNTIKSAAAEISLNQQEIERPITQSYLGTPVIDNVEFPSGSFTDLEDNTIDFEGLTINAAIIEVNKTRNIVKTKVQGRDGTVKEYISEGDYEITCNGFISNADNVLPSTDLQKLRKIFEVPQQIEIISGFLNELFDIFNIVIEKWRIPQVEGKRNEIPFMFTASSDVPLDLEELE